VIAFKIEMTARNVGKNGNFGSLLVIIFQKHLYNYYQFPKGINKGDPILFRFYIPFISNVYAFYIYFTESFLKYGQENGYKTTITEQHKYIYIYIYYI